MIPINLQTTQIRLIKVIGKAAIEKNFPTEKNYSYNDSIIRRHLNNPLNGYGVLCGPGSLIGIDGDSPELCTAIETSLPETLTVKSGKAFINGKGGKHYYFICPGWTENLVLGEQGEHGHVQAKNKFLVGPGSPHYIKDKPSGYKYVVEKDIPIAVINIGNIKKVVEQFITIKKEIPKTTSAIKNKTPIRIEDVISLSKLEQRGNEYQGTHPGHGSETGQNFSVNPSEGIWHCFRHGTGGDGLMLFAVMEGMLNCEDCQSGALQGEKYIKVREKAIEKGLLPKEAENQEITEAITRNEEIAEEDEFKNPLPPDHFISRYIQMNAEISDTYPEYALNAAFFLLSTAAGRKPRVNITPNKKRLNVWCLNIGLSTISRKSTASDIAEAVLNLSGLTERIAQDGSPEGFIMSLIEHPHAPLIRDEYGSFLANMRKKYCEGLNSFLCTIYDAKDTPFERKLRKETIILKNIYMPLLGSATPSSITDVIQPSDFETGFTPRHLILWPERPKVRMNIRAANKEDDEKKIKLAEDLAEINYFFENQPHDYDINLTEDAFIMYNQWCQDIEEQIMQGHGKEDTTILLGRLQEYVVKLAALIEIGRIETLIQCNNINKLTKLTINLINIDDDTNYNPKKTVYSDVNSVNLANLLIMLIKPDSLATALYFVQELYLKHGLKLVNLIRSHSGENQIERIYDIAVKHMNKNELTHSELLQLSHLKSKDFKDVITTLLESGRFMQKTVETGGRHKIIYIPVRSSESARSVKLPSLPSILGVERVFPEVIMPTEQISLVPVEKDRVEKPRDFKFFVLEFIQNSVNGVERLELEILGAVDFGLSKEEVYKILDRLKNDCKIFEASEGHYKINQ
jgi:hypothetical protein